MDTPRDYSHSAGDVPDDPGHHDGDHGGTGKYWMVFIALCVLTTASFLTFFDFWNENIPPNVSRTFMMAVSCTKAFLVMAFFMHLIWEANWKYVLTIPAGMMSIFLMLMLVPDIGCRYPHYSYDRLIHSADPGTGEHGHDDVPHDDSADHLHGHAHEGAEELGEDPTETIISDDTDVDEAP